MKAPATIALACIVSCTPAVHAACNQGAYASGGGDYVVVVPLPDPNAAGQRYLFRDGRRGNTADATLRSRALADAVTIKKSDGSQERWKQLPLTTTDTRFTSVETRARGTIDRAARRRAGGRPLVVMVHGSERTSALNSPYAYSLAAQGIAVFVYDKRGTGSFRRRVHAELRAAGRGCRRRARAREDDDARSHQPRGLLRRQPGRLGCAARSDALRRATSSRSASAWSLRRSKKTASRWFPRRVRSASTRRLSS